MQQRNIALANLAGTTLMTLFSEVVSKLKHENFSEPELLSKFLENQPVSLNKTPARAAGWVGHYLVGQAFAMAYALTLKELKGRPSTKNGLAMGVISGLAGIGIWKATFKIHPHPPKTPKKQYFVQLLLAHMVFGLVADGVLQLLDKPKHKPDEPLVKVEPAANTYYPLQDESAVVSPS